MVPLREPCPTNLQQELRDAEDLEKFRNILSDADRSIKWKLAEALSLVADDIQKKVRSIFEDRLNEFKNIGASWDAFVQEEFHIDGGFLTKIPNIAWEILNVVTIKEQATPPIRQTVVKESGKSIKDM